MMARNVRGFMSLFRCGKPVVCRVHGFCVAGGTDMALCSDLLVIAEDAKIGYPPARVWGSPTTALWAHRVGAQRAKRLLFTGDSLSGREALEWGLAIEAPPAQELVARTEILLERIARVPVNQLMMMKLLVNETVYAQGLHATQVLGTVFDGIARHTAEGYAFQAARRAGRISARRCASATSRSGIWGALPSRASAHMRSYGRGVDHTPAARSAESCSECSRPGRSTCASGTATRWRRPSARRRRSSCAARRRSRTSCRLRGRWASVAPTSTARWRSMISTARSLVVDEWEPPPLSVV